MAPPSRPWGIYVHVPWCRVRCPYCDFNVHRAPARIPARFVDAVLAQVATMAPAWDTPPTSLFLGGGTPSLLPPDLLQRLLAGLDAGRLREVSLEANPEDVDAGRLSAWRSLGVTRLSVGLQTLDPAVARLLRRAHQVERGPAILDRVAAAGFRSWSVDLIFAVPGQPPARFLEHLDVVLERRPPHLSLYGLTAEPRTPLGRAVAAGRIRLPDAEAWREAYEGAVERLAAAGLERYEVSNFARRGHRSHHNEHYWRLRTWMGVGPGAHGRLPDGSWTETPRDPAAWMSAPVTGLRRHRPSPEERAADLLAATLRHVDGVERRRLDALGFRLPPALLRSLARAGLLRPDVERVRLGPRGWALADAVTDRLHRALLPAAEPGDAPPPAP